MSERVPRLAFEALPGPLAEALRPRVERLGYLGEFFQCAANVPEALLAFQHFSEALKRALGERLTELVALTVAVRLGNAYERHQHEQLCRKLGFTDDWVRAVELLGTIDLAPEDAAVQRLVMALLDRHGHGADAELGAVVDCHGAPVAMAVLLTVGRYATHSLVVNALTLAPPVPSIFESP